jgi:hypothetical protein
MSRRLLLTLTLAFVVLLPRAEGAAGPAVPVARAPLLRFLNQKAIRDELKVTADQMKKVGEAVKQLREKREAALDRGEKVDRMDLLKDMDSSVGVILKPAQLKRLRQIALQMNGAAVLGRREFAKYLKLSADQQKKLKALQKESAAAARKLFEGDYTREEARKKLAGLNVQVYHKIVAVLNADQKAKWKALAGEPFKGVLRRGPPPAKP